MKKYIYMAVAAIAALSSCSSDNDPIIEEPGKQALTFTATMEGDDTTARALYNSASKSASWEEGDKISINGKTYNAQGAGLTTTFKAATQGQDASGSTYNAYFPASLYNNTTATLPAAVSETWADGKFNMPMYATSTTTNLQFHNLCGVLKITVKSDQIDKVKKIKVSSANKAVSGAFTVDANNAAVLTNASNKATLTVTYTAAVPTTAEGVVFYVAVPAQTYQQLKIQLSADGTNFTKSMTTKINTDIAIQRKTIYPITFVHATKGTAKATIKDRGEVDVNWVQLWDGGPKFAEYNIGATAAHGFGGHFCWGKSIDNDKDGTGKGGTAALTGNDDTATNLWGSNWRMPTQAELNDLLSKCTVKWVNNYNNTGSNRNGRLFTGQGDYASNSVFLSATGYSGTNASISGQGSAGYYWSSTPNSDLYAGSLFFKSDLQEIRSTTARWYHYSVRPVLKE